MADRYPLVVASGVVQELVASDNLDLTGNHIVNASGIGATSLNITGISTIGILTGGIDIFGSSATDNSTRANNIAIGRSASSLVGIMTGMNNVAMGYSAQFPCVGGHDNVVFGVEAGVSLSGLHVHSGAGGSTAEYNFLCLRGSGSRLTIGSRNVFIGLGAGAGVTEGNHNYCVGEDTMSLPANGGRGDNNICLGDQAGRNLTSGDGNVVIGKQAGISANGIGASFTGATNVIIGQSAGYVMRDGNNNTIVGTEAGLGVTNGGFNVFSGYRSGYSVTQGQSNVCIGGSAGSNLTTGSANVVIGPSAQASSATVSNEVTLYNGINLARFQGSATAWTFTSDERLKENIENLPFGLDFLSNVQPRQYTWKESGDPGAGFIAQELDSVVAEQGAEVLGLVDKSDPDQYLVAATALIPVLVKAIQELKTEVDALKAAK